MATHSSILARRISWTEERDGLQSMGSERVRRDLACVWEVGRLWARCNHSFDVHLSSLGPISCVYTSWVSSVLTGSHWRSAISDDCDILCLLIQQEIFHFSHLIITIPTNKINILKSSRSNVLSCCEFQIISTWISFKFKDRLLAFPEHTANSKNVCSHHGVLPNYNMA